MPQRSLICGVSGQDGAYLAQLLRAKGHEVWGTSRNPRLSDFIALKGLKIFDQVNILPMTMGDFSSVCQVISEIKPHHVYNLAGQSSVALSFERPLETMVSIATGTLNILEAIRSIDKRIRFFNAGSAEVFGDTGERLADENTLFRPRSPYAVAKAAAAWHVSVYREAYDLFACTGILFNHESPYRQDRFVTKKIVASALRISSGSQEKLRLGNLDVCRDWGWAEEYVVAIWKILNLNEPEDFVIATGVEQSLRDFTTRAFEEAGLDWRQHVIIDADLMRPAEPLKIIGNPRKAERLLGWKPTITGGTVAKKMFRDLSSLSSMH